MKALVTGFDAVRRRQGQSVVAGGEPAQEADRQGDRRAHGRAADLLRPVGQGAARGDRQGQARHRAVRRPGRRPHRALPRAGRASTSRMRASRDNDGKQPIDVPVRDGRPGGLFLDPADQGLRRGDAQGGAAGRRVEHRRHLRLQPHLLCADGHRRAAIRSRMRGGFLHIPYVPEQAARLGGAPSMAVDDIVRGIEIIVAISAARTDLHTVEGRIS